MKLITLPIKKEKLNRKNITIAIALVLLAILAVGYIWLQNTGRLTKFNLGEYLQKLTAGLTEITERDKQPKDQQSEELTPQNLEITLPPTTGGAYEQTAQSGDGITHLARRAAKEYLDRTEQGADLTPEHKVYIEDYITKKTGDRWLQVGEKLSFSEDLIKEAVESSRQLTAEQLANLTQYAILVSSF